MMSWRENDVAVYAVLPGKPWTSQAAGRRDFAIEADHTVALRRAAVYDLSMGFVFLDEVFPISTTFPRLALDGMSSLDLTSNDVPAVVELHSAIETPENVVLTYRLAGPALRLWAYLIDTVVRGMVLFVALVAAQFSELAVEGVPMGMWLLLLFLMEWGYFAFLEGFFRGKTIGKYAMSIRVIQEAGYPISFWSAMMRNILRAADIIPLYGIGFISAAASGKFRRLGDLAAGTVVIEERKVRLPREPIILDKIQPLSRSDIGTYVPPQQTMTLIEEFLQRRFEVTHQRGHELAAHLAAVLAKKLNFHGEANFVEEYPMAFLARVYVTFHPSMTRDADEEQNLSPDHGQPAVTGEAVLTSP